MSELLGRSSEISMGFFTVLLAKVKETNTRGGKAVFFPPVVSVIHRAFGWQLCSLRAEW